MDKDGELRVGGESRDSDTTGAEVGLNSMDGGTRASGIHSVLFQNFMQSNAQSINEF